MANKYSMEEVKSVCENLGLELKSNEYVKVKDNLLVECRENGYLAYISLGSMLRGSTPMWFAKINPYTIRNIQIWMNKHEPTYTLHSTEFVDAGLRRWTYF